MKMSPKHFACLCLVIALAIAAHAVPTESKPTEDDSVHPVSSKQTRSVDPTDNHETRRHVRVARHRHSRNPPMLPEVEQNIQEVFQNRQDQDQRHQNRRSVSQFPFGYLPYPFLPNFYNAFPQTPTSSHFQNYYYFGNQYQVPFHGQLPAGVSHLQHSNGAPYNPPFFSTPIFYIIPCSAHPQAPTQTPEIPTTSTEKPVGSRDDFPTDNLLPIPQRPKTPTGISLAVIPPIKPPSRPAPPLDHSVPSAPAYNGRPDDSNLINEAQPVYQQAPRPTQRPQRPPPPRPVVTQRPFNQRPTQRPFAPEAPQPQEDPASNKLSNCVLAIISCCNSRNSNFDNQQRCFERMGCEGAFFGNPCNSELSKQALQTYGNFQSNNNPVWS